MVEVSCPHCGVKLKAPDDHIGKKAKCKKCRQPFRVPGTISAADLVSEPKVPGTTPLPLPDDDEDDRTELISADDLPLPPLPPPKAKPAPVPAKNVASLPSADPFDFSKPAAPAPAPTAKPAVGAVKAAAPAPAPVPVAKPAPPMAKPAPVPPVAAPVPAPAAKSSSGAAKTAPPAPVPVAKPAPKAEPLEDIPFDEPLPTKSDKPKAKPAAAPLPDPEPVQPPAADNAFAFGFNDEPAKPKKAKSRDEEEPDNKKDAKKKKKPDEEEPEPANKKAPAKAKSQPAPEPAGDAAFAFGFSDEPIPEDETPRRKKKREPIGDDEPEPLETKKRKKGAEDESEDEEEDRPRYRRPEEKGSGMFKAVLITGAAGFLALGLGIAATLVYVKNNRPQPVKEEKKKEEPEPPPPAPIVVPPAPPAPPKVDPKPKDKAELPKEKEKEPEPKPKDKAKEPEPKPKEKAKEPEPVATRPALELAIKGRPFEIGKEKEQANFERADKPSRTPFVLETPFASVLRVFPPFDPNTADTYVVVRDGTKLSLDAYSPSSDKRVAQLPFTADLAKPLCDVRASVTDTQFLAVADGKVTVWELANSKKLIDAVDPYADKPDHKKNGLAAVFFSTQPGHIVTVSTAGAVHLYGLATKGTVAEFLPPHGAKGKVALGESVARAEGGASIVLAVGGIIYQIQADGNLDRLREHDLKGDVKPLAIAASGTPGPLLFAFETDAKGKKDRALFYLPPGAGAKPKTSLWPAAAGTPKGALWVNDSSAGIVTESGVVWFDEDMNVFAPLVVTRPDGGSGLYVGSTRTFWYVVPRPNKAAQSALVPLPVPLDGTADFRREAATKLRVLIIDQNGLKK